ncbi:MAG: hypothetical protein JW942_00535 [Opitutales bacterium]|nr:hypothetical protein [Opitutales bacterium]
MKKNIVLFAALALGAASVTAQEVATTTAPAISVTSSFGYESEYVFRGVQLADAIITPSIDVAYGDFYAGLWFAVPVEHQDVYVNEMDFYVGYSTAISSLLTIDAGATRYAYDEVIGDFFDKSNTLEGYVGISADVLLNPSVYAYYDIDLDVFTTEVSIGHSIALNDKFSADLGLSGGYATEDDGDADYFFYGATADLSYAINDSSSVGFGARFSGSDEDMVYGSSSNMDWEKNIFWYGFSFSTGF